MARSFKPHALRRVAPESSDDRGGHEPGAYTGVRRGRAEGGRDINDGWRGEVRQGGGVEVLIDGQECIDEGVGDASRKRAGLPARARARVREGRVSGEEPRQQD